MKVAKAILTVSFLIFITALAFAEADPKTKQMMDEVMNKAQKVESYRVDLRMETTMMNQEMVTEGEMAFKKPNKMHMVTVMSAMPGMKQEIFSKGDMVWTYMPSMNMVTKVDMSKIKANAADVPGGMRDTADITRPFEGFAEENIKFLEKKTENDKEYYLFEVKPSEPAGEAQSPQMLPNRIVFWIHAGTGLPHRVTMYAKDGARMMEQKYSNFRLNVPMEDSEFEFTPPEGAQVMDMTDATMNMMKQMKEGQPVQPPPTE
jgi:outer membrane lipoprotein-sorting protein